MDMVGCIRDNCERRHDLGDLLHGFNFIKLNNVILLHLFWWRFLITYEYLEMKTFRKLIAII